MNERQKKFVKQRLLGIAVLALSALEIAMGSCTVSVIFIPVGLYLVCTKRLWVDNFFDDEEK